MGFQRVSPSRPNPYPPHPYPATHVGLQTRDEQPVWPSTFHRYGWALTQYQPPPPPNPYAPQGIPQQQLQMLAPAPAPAPAATPTSGPPRSKLSRAGASAKRQAPAPKYRIYFSPKFRPITNSSLFTAGDRSHMPDYAWPAYESILEHFNRLKQTTPVSLNLSFSYNPSYCHS